jgi:hypothetical protein
MLKLLNPYFGKIYVTQVNIERAATIDEIIEQAPEFKEKMIPLTIRVILSIILFRRSKKMPGYTWKHVPLGEIKSKIINKNT